MKTPLTAAAAALLLAGCTNLSEIGREPELSPILHHPSAGLHAAHYYPKATPSRTSRSSLWDDRQSRLFTDPRALSTGDILTVAILINDRAQLRNQSERRRSAERDFAAKGSIGWEDFSTSGKGGVDLGGGSRSSGRGQTERSEDIRLSIAAVVTDVLPNGNLIIRGSQEVRVNAELRVLNIEGIVRPADIGANNTISYERIAEARITYGGRGRLTEVQQPPYGHQILDAVMPF
jgi:flagellar L-ring protein FlgH